MLDLPIFLSNKRSSFSHILNCNWWKIFHDYEPIPLTNAEPINMKIELSQTINSLIWFNFHFTAAIIKQKNSKLRILDKITGSFLLIISPSPHSRSSKFNHPPPPPSPYAEANSSLIGSNSLGKTLSRLLFRISIMVWGGGAKLS